MFLTLPDDDIIIADPEGEYYPLVNRLGGQVVRLSPSATAGTFINPMDINPNYADDEDPLSLKSDFILSLCELIVGGRSGLAPVEKTVIDRCVRTIYRPYLADPAPERMPILQDLYDELLKQSEPEARRVASALELYCTGSLNLFNHRTNVQVNSRLLCFDIKALGKMLKKIGLLILTDQIWGRVTENRDRRRATWVYQDEFHVLLAEPQTAAYSVEIFRRFRKWGAIPSGITQNVKSLLESSEIESIFGNCDFLYMLSQAAGDQKVLASHLGISPHQLSYVTHSGSGEGLLFYGDTTIPFLGPGVGGEKFRPGENDVFLKRGINERGYIFRAAPTRRSVLLVPAVFFRVFGLDVDEQPDGRRPRDPYQPVRRDQPRGGGSKGRVDGIHHAHQLLPGVGPCRQTVGRPQLQTGPGHEQVGQIGEEIFFQATFLHAPPPSPALSWAAAAAAPRPASSAPGWGRAAPWAGP